MACMDSGQYSYKTTAFRVLKHFKECWNVCENSYFVCWSFVRFILEFGRKNKKWKMSFLCFAWLSLLSRQSASAYFDIWLRSHLSIFHKIFLYAVCPYFIWYMIVYLLQCTRYSYLSMENMYLIDYV